MTRCVRLMLTLLLAAPAAGASAATDPTIRDWALARCIARATTGQPFAADATRSAAALLERGSSAIDDYARIERLIATTLARPRSGSTGGSYATLACLDLVHGPAMAAIVDHQRGHR